MQKQHLEKEPVCWYLHQQQSTLFMHSLCGFDPNIKSIHYQISYLIKLSFLWKQMKIWFVNSVKTQIIKVLFSSEGREVSYQKFMFWKQTWQDFTVAGTNVHNTISSINQGSQIKSRLLENKHCYKFSEILITRRAFELRLQII